jgi:ribosomal protein S18 acetylase RimI-like enzyme
MPRAPKASSSGGGDLPPIEGPRVRAVPAVREHAAQLQACLEGAPDYFARTEGSPPGSDAGARLLADAEGDDLRRVYLLVHTAGGAAVGMLDLYLHHPEPGVAHVALLLFRESCQGLGYGKETTAAMEDALRRAGYSAIRLSVGDENPEAKSFWQRIGFAEVGRLDRGVTVYEKKLE